MLSDLQNSVHVLSLVSLAGGEGLGCAHRPGTRAEDLVAGCVVRLELAVEERHEPFDLGVRPLARLPRGNEELIPVEEVAVARWAFGFGALVRGETTGNRVA